MVRESAGSRFPRQTIVRNALCAGGVAAEALTVPSYEQQSSDVTGCGLAGLGSRVTTVPLPDGNPLSARERVSLNFRPSCDSLSMRPPAIHEVRSTSNRSSVPCIMMVFIAPSESPGYIPNDQFAVPIISCLNSPNDIGIFIY